MTQTYNQVYVLSFQSHKRFTSNFSSKQIVRIEVYKQEGVTLIFEGDGKKLHWYEICTKFNITYKLVWSTLHMNCKKLLFYLTIFGF